MKNSEEIETPLVNIDRSPIIVILSLLISIAIAWLGYYLLVNVNPWGFLVLVPAAILSFQTLWMLLNPFALVFKDKIEIKQTLFSNKIWYFIDIKKIAMNKKGRLYIVYQDDEVEPLNLRGIKPSQITLLKTEIEKSAYKGL